MSGEVRLSITRKIVGKLTDRQEEKHIHIYNRDRYLQIKQTDKQMYRWADIHDI